MSAQLTYGPTLVQPSLVPFRPTLSTHCNMRGGTWTTSARTQFGDARGALHSRGCLESRHTLCLWPWAQSLPSWTGTRSGYETGSFWSKGMQHLVLLGRKMAQRSLQCGDLDMTPLKQDSRLGWAAPSTPAMYPRIPVPPNPMTHSMLSPLLL